MNIGQLAELTGVTAREKTRATPRAAPSAITRRGSGAAR
jgi:hypothetical protein